MRTPTALVPHLRTTCARADDGAYDWPSVKIALAILAAVGLFAAVACPGDDNGAAERGQESAIQTQRAELHALQTQVSLPTKTPLVLTPAPDVVVGVAWKCVMYSHGAPSDEVGDTCRIRYQSNYLTEFQAKGTIIQNIEADVTVRTALGSAYHATVTDPPKLIPIGDTWPPP